MRKVYRKKPDFRTCFKKGRKFEELVTNLAYLLGQDDINALSMRYLALSNLSKKKTWL